MTAVRGPIERSFTSSLLSEKFTWQVPIGAFHFIGLGPDARNGRPIHPKWSEKASSDWPWTLSQTPKCPSPRNKMSPIGLGHSTHQPIKLSPMAPLISSKSIRSGIERPTDRVGVKRGPWIHCLMPNQTQPASGSSGQDPQLEWRGTLSPG